MAQQYMPQQKTRTALVLFLKGVATPLLLYFENPQAVYLEMKQLMKNPSPVLVEKDAIGPVKKVVFVSTQIAGVVLQEETYV
ncbi:hypothetical protein IKJ53_05915 [bacterium]|nr:hypothetical protein [bacterium]